MKQKPKPKTYKTRNVAPGTLSYRGKKTLGTTYIDIINYSPEVYTVLDTQKVEDAFHFKEKDTVTWINMNGLNNVDDIEALGKHYHLHDLTLEDIGNMNHLPKMDVFENYLFIVFKMLYFHGENDINYEHMSMVVGDGYVLTFQEADDDVFDELRKRISKETGRIRGLGADYLMYSILDAVVDQYLTILEAFGDKVEDLEDEVFNTNHNKDISNKIQIHKREILKIRRSVVPLREVINKLDKTETKFIQEKTYSYLGDLYDHIVQVNENIEIHREMVWSLMDMFMTITSNKMNEIMKVLTIISTIFIPLTFIAGIYGMNFDNLPELHYQYSYFILWGIMIFIVLLMLFYFRRKKWL